MARKLFRITTVALSQNLLLEGQLRYLNARYDVTAIASGADELRRVGEREGVRVLPVDMAREISPLRDLRSLWRLYRLFRRERPHIVHANTPKGSLLGMTAAFAAGVPHRVYTVTGLRFESERGALRRLLAGMERLTCVCATRVIPEGDGVRTLLLRERITRKPLEKLHNGNINGVDADRYRLTPELLAAGNVLREGKSFTLCFVGRLVRDKGIAELTEAFVRFHALHPDTLLLLVGPAEPELDPLDPVTLGRIANHPAIRSFGFREDVRPYLAAADLFLFPSYREGFPNVLLQAGAMGVPSIASDITGCNEILREGVNGVLVPARDASALFDALLRLYEDRSLLASLAAHARGEIVARFHRNDVWRALEALYETMD